MVSEEGGKVLEGRCSATLVAVCVLEGRKEQVFHAIERIGRVVEGKDGGGNSFSSILAVDAGFAFLSQYSMLFSSLDTRVEARGIDHSLVVSVIFGKDLLVCVENTVLDVNEKLFVTFQLC